MFCFVPLHQALVIAHAALVPVGQSASTSPEMGHSECLSSGDPLAACVHTSSKPAGDRDMIDVSCELDRWADLHMGRTTFNPTFSLLKESRSPSGGPMANCLKQCSEILQQKQPFPRHLPTACSKYESSMKLAHAVQAEESTLLVELKGR